MVDEGLVLYHAAPVSRALAIMLRGFDDRRDAAARTAYGIWFQSDPVRADERFAVALSVRDRDAVRRYAVALAPEQRDALARGDFYVLPADVANCFAARMIGSVNAGDSVRDT